MNGIFPARPEYADKLTKVTITAKRHWNYPETWIQLWLPVLTISTEYISANETWMAMIDNEPVAYYSLKKNGNSIWLDNLWVLPNQMGRGFGKSLLEHAIEISRKHGASVLRIEADPNAESFYERMGARKVGEHRGELDGQLRILPLMEIDL